MKRTKTLVIAAAVAAALGTAVHTAAEAQGPRGGAAVDGPRARPGGGFGLMPMLRGLDLTEAQREQLRAIREEGAPSQDAALTGGRLQRQLEIELLAEVPDQQKLWDLQRQILDAEAARLTKRIEVGQKVGQVLTAEQRATLRERLAQAPERRGPGPRRGRPAPGAQAPGAAPGQR